MKKLFPIKSLTDKKIRKKIVMDMDRGIVTLQKELHCFFPDWDKVMLLSLYVEISELLREKMIRLSNT